MLPPEICYQFRSAVDTASATIDLVQRRKVTASVAASQSVDLITVPSDRILILTQCLIVATGLVGGVPNTTQLAYNFDTLGSVYVPVYQDSVSGVAGSSYRQQIVRDGNVWIPPGARLYASASFSAAVNSAIDATIHGLLIPRGNVSMNTLSL